MKRRKRNNEEETLGNVIDKLIQSWGMTEKKKELDIINSWGELMGNGVASRTENMYINNKVLHIKLNSSVMRDELQHGKNVIIQRVNEFAKKEIIFDIWFE